MACDALAPAHLGTSRHCHAATERLLRIYDTLTQ